MAKAKQGKYTGQHFGSVKLLDKIGSGGMGEVYRGFHEIMQIDVAVKLIHPHLAESEEFVQRFLREAQTTISLTHPNILRVYTAERWERIFYMVLEFVDGTDLRKVLRKRHKLPWQATLTLVEQTACGLVYAHVKGVVHRDIKPENLLMTRQGDIKIADFGLATAAQAVQRLTATGQIMGSPLYMSPEQAEARDLDSRSDIYSLGATWYHLLTGTPPFTAPTVAGILAQHVTKDVKFPTDRFDGIPPELIAVLKAMLRRNVEQRIDNIQGVEDACRSLNPKKGATASRAAVQFVMEQKPADGGTETRTTTEARRSGTVDVGAHSSALVGSDSAVIDPALYMGLDSPAASRRREAPVAAGVIGVGEPQRSRFSGAAYDWSQTPGTERVGRSRVISSERRGAVLVEGPRENVVSRRGRTVILLALLLAVLAIGGFYVYRDVILPMMRTEDGDGPITITDPRAEAGIWVAFTALTQEGNADLYQVRLEGSSAASELFDMTNSQGSESWPRFSPNGEHIAYVCETQGTPEVWSVDRHGKTQSQLTNPSRRPQGTSGALGPVSWRVVASDEPFLLLYLASHRSQHARPSQVSEDGSRSPSTGLTVDDPIAADLSPNGDLVAIVHGDASNPRDQQLLVAEFPTGRSDEIVPAGTGPYAPRWNLTSDRLCYLRRFNDQGESDPTAPNLVTIDANSENPLVHARDGRVHAATWFPDQSGRLIIAAGVEGSYNLYVYDPAAEDEDEALFPILTPPLHHRITHVDACQYGAAD